MRRLTASFAVVLLAQLLARRSFAAAEVCGNTADDDNDGLTDDGCWPQGVPDVGICEQPVSCAVAGAVAPKTGNLVYPVQSDLAPGVAFGPGLVFQRVYMSLYAPTYNFPSATDYKAPLGYRWQH